MKKLTKKEQQLQKKQAKEKAKQEKESIVKEYLDKIDVVVDNKYVDLMIIIENFNEELMRNTIEYFELVKLLKRSISEAVNDDNDNLEDSRSAFVQSLDGIGEKISKLEKDHEGIHNTITSRNEADNRILSYLPVIAEEVAKEISIANKELEGNKNQAYIVSMIINRSFSLLKTRNHIIVDTTLESNDYIDNYIDAREEFIDFVVACRKEFERLEQESKEINEKVISLDQIKYNQRLRVDYSQLQCFLKHKGYMPIRQNSTTHEIWRHEISGVSMPLANKSGTIPQGTTSKVLKQMGSNRQELAEFLYA